MKKHDARRCMRCKYHGWGASQTICEYILEKNEPRGCPAGENCTRFEPGKRKQKIKSRRNIPAESQDMLETYGS